MAPPFNDSKIVNLCCAKTKMRYAIICKKW
jgi:hypothetical protein